MQMFRKHDVERHVTFLLKSEILLLLLFLLILSCYQLLLSNFLDEHF